MRRFIAYMILCFSVKTNKIFTIYRHLQILVSTCSNFAYHTQSKSGKSDLERRAAGEDYQSRLESEAARLGRFYKET
jgi:hypothetical protein